LFILKDQNPAGSQEVASSILVSSTKEPFKSITYKTRNFTRLKSLPLVAPGLRISAMIWAIGGLQASESRKEKKHDRAKNG
jgi:hypothetical protein